MWVQGLQTREVSKHRATSKQVSVCWKFWPFKEIWLDCLWNQRCKPPQTLQFRPMALSCLWPESHSLCLLLKKPFKIASGNNTTLPPEKSGGCWSAWDHKHNVTCLQENNNVRRSHSHGMENFCLCALEMTSLTPSSQNALQLQAPRTERPPHYNHTEPRQRVTRRDKVIQRGNMIASHWWCLVNQRDPRSWDPYPDFSPCKNLNL